MLSDRDGLSGEAYAIPIGDSGRPDGPPVRVSLNAQWISHGGSRIAYSNYSRLANIWSLPIPSSSLTVPLRTDAAKPVTSGRQIIELVSVSPDRRWLVYDSNESGTSDIYRLSLEDSSSRREPLTSDSTQEFWGVLSPDGKYLAYHAYIDGKRRLRVKRIADGHIEQPVLESGDQGAPQWSPDGNAIAAWKHDHETGEVIVARRAPHGGWVGPAWRLPNAQLPIWSPDGRDLAFVTLGGSIELIAADSGARRVLYTPRPGTQDPKATNLVWQAGWDYLLFIGEKARAGGIWAMPLVGGDPRQVVSFASVPGGTYGPTFAVDATRLYFVLDERNGNVRYAELVKR